MIGKRIEAKYYLQLALYPETKFTLWWDTYSGNEAKIDLCTEYSLYHRRQNLWRIENL